MKILLLLLAALKGLAAGDSQSPGDLSATGAVLRAPRPEGVPADWPMLPAAAQPDKNVLQRPLELQFFFKKLKDLERGLGGRQVVRIVQLGDSHLQSGEFSGFLRQKLQLRFGDAGRGLVFPYEPARTTNPSDLHFESDTIWASRRSAGPAPAGVEWLETGVSGFALFASTPSYLMSLRLGSGRFDKLTLFRRREALDLGVALSGHEDPHLITSRGLTPRQKLHEVAPGETLTGIAQAYDLKVKDLMRLNRLKSDKIFPGDKLVVGREERQKLPPRGNGFKDLVRLPGGAGRGVSETVELDQEVDTLYFRGFAEEAKQDEALWWGMSLERKTLPGILYHSIGVNGAELKTYARHERFLEQARCLEPDLVIVSLGTNDANNRSLSHRDLEESLLTLMETFARGRSQYVAFILCTPPDTLTWAGRLNPASAQMAQRLRDFARVHGLALWDWQTVMGGPGSMLSWREDRLAWNDGVHFTPSGYRWQSRLFYDALMEAYGRY